MNGNPSSFALIIRHCFRIAVNFAMLRTAGRRLSALQPGLPLADQGSLLLLTTLRDRSACSTPPHAAAPSTTAAAAVGAAAAAAPLTAHSRQHSSRCSNGSNLGGTHRSSSWGEGLLSSSDAGSRPTGGGVLGGSSALRHLGSAAGAPPASTAGRRALHWSSAAAASATRQSRKAGEAALKKTVRTLLPETAVAKYLQDRVRPPGVRHAVQQRRCPVPPAVA